MRFLSVSLIVAALLLSGASALGETKYAPLPKREPNTPEVVIRRDFVDGKITRSEAALRDAQRLFKPSDLPERYQTGVSEGPKRCFTPQLLNLHRSWDAMPEEGRLLVPKHMRPDSGVKPLQIPKGQADSVALAAAKVDPGDVIGSPPVNENTHVTTNFIIHWNSSGPHSLAQPQDNNTNGIPDMVEYAGQYLEATWTWMIAQGYRLPPGTDTYYYNVYFESMPYWGYCMPIEAGKQPASYISLSNDFSGGFLPDWSPIAPADQLRSTASHEFFHACQFAYDVDEDMWWMEGTATWVMDQIGPAWDAVNDYVNWVGDFLFYPEIALDYHLSSSHWYSTVIWPIFLQEHVDPDGSIIREIWEACEGFTQAMDANKSVLSGYLGGGFTEAFREFLIANYTADYAEAPEYPFVWASVWLNDNVYSYPTGSRTPPQYLPQGLGSNYIKFHPNLTAGMSLDVYFSGLIAPGWLGIVVAKDGSTYDIQDVASGTTARVLDFNDSFDEAVLIVSPNMAESHLDYSFVYAAALVLADASAPTPNAMTWQSEPAAVSQTAIAMTATTATDADSPPVSYFFEETTGNAGGTDSGWTGNTAYTDTSLSPNTQYAYRVRARDSAPQPNATAWSSLVSVYTLCYTPAAPSLSGPSPTKIYVEISAGDGNGSATEYAIRNQTTGMYVSADGSPSASPYFATRSAWGIVRATGLSPSTSYTFAVKARNGDGIETAYGPGAALSTLAADVAPPAAPTNAATVPTWIKEGITSSAVLTALASDIATGGSDIKGAEYFIGADPGAGNGIPMSPADGAFDSPEESVTVTLNTSGWLIANNPYQLYMRAKDETNLWGPALYFPIEVRDGTPPTTTADLAGTAPAAGLEAAATLSLDSATSEIAGKEAAKAVDGSSASTWGTAGTAEPTSESIVIDLGEEGLYYKVTLRTSARTDLFPGSFKMRLGDGSDWWTVLSEAQYAATPGDNMWQFGPRVARKLKIEIGETLFDTGTSLYTAEIAEITVMRYLGGSSTVDLTWSAPSDVGPTGRADTYVVKYSTDRSALEAAFAGTQPVTAPPTPGSAGSPEALNVPRLMPSTSYHFALKSVDSYDNWSNISNVATVTTLADPNPYIALENPPDGGNLNVETPPTFTFYANIYDTFKVQFSNVPSFPARPVKDAYGRLAKTMSFGVRRGNTSFTPSLGQWKTIKKLAASMHGTLYWRIEGSSRADRALGKGHSEVFNEYGFDMGEYLSTDLTPYQLEGGVKAIWPSTRPQFGWQISDELYSKFYIDFSATEDFYIKDRKACVVIQCRNTARNVVPTWYKPSSADWKKIKKTIAAGNNGLVYWRVRGLDMHKAFSAASAPQALLILPPTFTLRQPAPRRDGTVMPGEAFLLDWGIDGEGYTTFEVQISSDDQFVRGPNTMSRRNLKTTTMSVSVGWARRLQKILDAAATDTFYWRVIATDLDRSMSVASDPETARLSVDPAP